MNHRYDIVIIGAGMAGLYTGYLLKKNNPNISFIILESNAYIGGRALNDTFRGSTIVPGAGIGRVKKDKLLCSLMDDLGLEINEFPFKPNYAISPIIDVKKVIKYLRKLPRTQETFETFAKNALGEDLYKQFVLSAGYTDYLKEDMYETLYNYGMDDNACCWNGFSVPWNDLTEKMANFIGKKQIKLSNTITSIKMQQDNTILVNTNDKKMYRANKIVLATPIDSIRKLLRRYPIYKEIKGQPFMRVFVQFSRSSIGIMKNNVKGFTIVNGPLQKIIPINPDDGIYMIAYNDNKNAIYLNKHASAEELARLTEKALSLQTHSLTITHVKSYYWKIGTHYFTPLNTEKYKDRKTFLTHAQHPHPNIYVVGEALSLNQGWTEGALESVIKIYFKL